MLKARRTKVKYLHTVVQFCAHDLPAVNLIWSRVCALKESMYLPINPIREE